MSELTPELQVEIEEILGKSQKRHGFVFREIKKGLTPEEIGKLHDRTPAHMKKFVTSVQHILDGTMPSSSLVVTNSFGYRELLNYDTSHDLHEYVVSWLHKLKEKKPEVSFEPLDGDALQSTVTLKRKTEVVETVCPQCFMVHPGECY